MKLQARIRDRVHTLELTRDGNRFVVRIDGTPHALDLVFSDASHDVVLIDNACYDVVCVAQPGGYHVNVLNRFFDVEILDPRTRATRGSETTASGDRPILATMPGRIVKVLVEDGQQVAAGAGLVVLEAMKMQNELRAPRAGRVRQLSVQAGQTVEAGQLLLIVGEEREAHDAQPRTANP